MYTSICAKVGIYVMFYYYLMVKRTINIICSISVCIPDIGHKLLSDRFVCMYHKHVFVPQALQELVMSTNRSKSVNYR